MHDDAAQELRDLYETVERLRAPGGCPWDRAQSHRSLSPYLLEEAYEALEAIDSGRPPALSEELGDVLLQVFMHSAIAAEAGEAGFDIGDVAAATRRKMVHRHPHVFGDASVSGAAEVVVNWERLKAAEKKGRLSVLDGVPRTLPALAYALGVQKRPARLGFDETGGAPDAVAGLRAAVEALAATPEARGEAARPDRGADWTPAVTPPDPVPVPRAGHGAGPPPARTELDAAVGDLLFAAVAVARLLRVNPEDALRRRANRFADRFRAVETAAREEGVDLHSLDSADWGPRWASTAPAGEAG